MKTLVGVVLGLFISTSSYAQPFVYNLCCNGPADGYINSMRNNGSKEIYLRDNSTATFVKCLLKNGVFPTGGPGSEVAVGTAQTTVSAQEQPICRYNTDITLPN